MLINRRQATLDELRQWLRLSEEEAADLVSAFGLDTTDDGRMEAQATPDAVFQRRLMDTAIQNSGIAPPGSALEDFARARLEALVKGADEDAPAWGAGWPTGLDAASRGQPEQDGGDDYRDEDHAVVERPEAGGRMAVRVIAVPTDEGGIDPAELERLLNEAGSEGFGMEGTQLLVDQPLKGGSRGHIFVLTKYDFD